MILGFAHLAINVANLDEAESFWEELGYSCVSRHYDVPNHCQKKAFGNNFKNDHDLVLLKASHLWPLELTYHGPSVGKNNQITWSPERIVLKVHSPQELINFFVDGLGFKVEIDGDLSLESRLPEWSCRIRVEECDEVPVRIDATGPTCLAFYCNRIEDEIQRLVKLGAIDCTDIFGLTLGERIMNIAMMRLPGGPLLELINPRRRR